MNDKNVPRFLVELDRHRRIGAGSQNYDVVGTYQNQPVHTTHPDQVKLERRFTFEMRVSLFDSQLGGWLDEFDGHAHPAPFGAPIHRIQRYDVGDMLGSVIRLGLGPYHHEIFQPKTDQVMATNEALIADMFEKVKLYRQKN